MLSMMPHNLPHNILNRIHGPTSEIYCSAKALSLLFESLFDAAFDHIRGFGGRGDIPYFKHGSHWYRCYFLVLDLY